MITLEFRMIALFKQTLLIQDKPDKYDDVKERQAEKSLPLVCTLLSQQIEIELLMCYNTM